MMHVFLILVCFWLFYGWRIIEKKTNNFAEILFFAINMVDTLLFLHYTSVVVLWIRQTDPSFLCVENMFDQTKKLQTKAF